MSFVYLLFTWLKNTLTVLFLLYANTAYAQTAVYPNKELNYPVWPGCEKDKIYLSEQVVCSEEAFAHFLRAKINWMDVSTTSIPRAQIYISVNCVGNVSGYGVVHCDDVQLTKELLQALSEVPNHWLPGNQSNNTGSQVEQADVIDARIYAELFWSAQRLDSVRFYKLIGVTRKPDEFYEVKALGDFLDYPGQAEVFIQQLTQDRKILNRLNKRPNVQDTLALRGMINEKGVFDAIEILQSSDKKITNATLHLLLSVLWAPIDYQGSDQSRIFLAEFVFNHKKRYPRGTVVFPIHQNGFMFPDGSLAALRFINSRLEIPPNLIDNDLSSPIFKIQLFFNPDGRIYHYRIKESVHPIIDRRIAAILWAGPVWETRRNSLKYKAVMELEYRVQIAP